MVFNGKNGMKSYKAPSSSVERQVMPSARHGKATVHLP